MSRHRLQLEAALLQGKTHLPLAHIYVNGAKKFSQQLSEINATGASVNDVLLPSPESPTEPTSPSNGTSSPTNGKKNGQEDGKANARETAKESEKGNGKENGKTNGHGDEKLVIKSKVESIHESEFEKGRLSAEELAKQFPNYNVGPPSKVLYVTNLDNNIAAEDLVSIFARFQEPGKDKIGFKLMDGKMKGKAFITFHDEQTATKALNLAHGFVFKSKPMIIQYGKQK